MQRQWNFEPFKPTEMNTSDVTTTSVAVAESARSAVVSIIYFRSLRNERYEGEWLNERLTIAFKDHPSNALKLASARAEESTVSFLLTELTDEQISFLANREPITIQSKVVPTSRLDVTRYDDTPPQRFVPEELKALKVRNVCVHASAEGHSLEIRITTDRLFTRESFGFVWLERKMSIELVGTRKRVLSLLRASTDGCTLIVNVRPDPEVLRRFRTGDSFTVHATSVRNSAIAITDYRFEKSAPSVEERVDAAAAPVIPTPEQLPTITAPPSAPPPAN